MNTISPEELKKKETGNEVFQLVDVREDFEYEEYNIGGIHIPLDEVLSSLDKIAKDKPVIFCCKTGKRSGAIVYTLERKLNFDNVFSLSGGVTAYRELN